MPLPGGDLGINSISMSQDVTGPPGGRGHNSCEKKCCWTKALTLPNLPTTGKTAKDRSTYSVTNMASYL